MTIAEPQPLSRVDEFLHPHCSNSDDQSNVRTFAPRSTSSTSTVAERQGKRAAPILPPVPSPPLSRIPPVPSPPARPLRYSLLPTSHDPLDHPPFIAMAANTMELQSQWLFTEEEIQNTFSVRDGITPAEESTRRAKGVNFIIQAGILLKLPQMTLGTAAVFFHRFYMRATMAIEKNSAGIHHYNIAATALFLASKAEETCRKTKEIVIAVAKVAQKNSSLIIDEQSKEFWRWKDNILMYEETMLEYLTFDVVVDSPYNFLYNFLQQLDVESNKPLRNVAWAFLNDMFMTTLCLLMPPKDIAIASIYFSAKFNKTKLPDMDGGPWWAHINGVPERIFKAIDVMADFYTDNPLKKSDNPYDHSPQNSIEDLERTRLRAESVSPNSRLRAEQAEEHAEKQDAEKQEDGPQNGIANGIEKDGDDKPSAEGEHNGDARDDDAKLKILANDPATHIITNEGEAPVKTSKANGISLKSPLKRKDSNGGQDPNPKRAKLVSEEESEEGELEE